MQADVCLPLSWMITYVQVFSRHDLPCPLKWTTRFGLWIWGKHLPSTSYNQNSQDDRKTTALSCRQSCQQWCEHAWLGCGTYHLRPIPWALKRENECQGAAGEGEGWGFWGIHFAAFWNCDPAVWSFIDSVCINIAKLQYVRTIASLPAWINLAFKIRTIVTTINPFKLQNVYSTRKMNLIKRTKIPLFDLRNGELVKFVTQHSTWRHTNQFGIKCIFRHQKGISHVSRDYGKGNSNLHLLVTENENLKRCQTFWIKNHAPSA